MGLLDKLKNVFFEEEYVEVDEPEREEPKEKVTVAKKIETPEVRKKDDFDLREEPVEKHVEEKKEEKIEKEPERDFFPMNFDDKDFEVEKTMELYEPVSEKKPEVSEEPVVEEKEEYHYEEVSYQEPVRVSREEKTEPYHRLYEGRDKEEKQGFTPSPIISPIYGILNKNYKKEEIVTKREVRLSQFSTKKADLDIVREKAYGELAGDISASIEEKETSPKEEKEDLLYDLNEEESPTVKVVTVGDAEEYFHDLGLEYNVDYKVEKEEPKPLKEEVKEQPKEVEKKEVVKPLEDDTEIIDAHQSDDNKINLNESNEDDKNLFDLIDSMYEDKE